MNTTLLHLFLSFFLMSIILPLSATEVIVTNPPKGWECIQDRTQLPQKVLLIYIGKVTHTTPLNPSLNIAYETTPLSLTEYTHLAKSYHESQRDTRCTLLGKVQTLSGEAQLMQIDRPSEWGDVRFIQTILIHQGTAYVTTATCLKKEFGQLAPHFYKAFQSIYIKNES